MTDSLDTASANNSPEAETASASLLPEILGIQSQPAALMTRSLATETEAMLCDHLDRKKAASDSASDDILSTMRSLRDHAETLHNTNSTPKEPGNEEIGAVLGIDSIEDAYELDQSIRRLQSLLVEALPEMDLPAGSHSAQTMIARLEAQLDVHTSAPDATDGPDGLLSSISHSFSNSSPRSAGDGAPVRHFSPSQDMVADVSSQLESLYEERGTPSTVGVGGENTSKGTERTGRSLRRPSPPSRKENRHQQQLVCRLREALGALRVDTIPDAADDSTSTPASLGSPSAEQAASESDTVPPHLLPPSTLNRLDKMQDDDLDELPVGVLRLADDGTVEYATDDGRRLPGLPSDQPTVHGKSLFRLVPSTTNTLFLTPFRDGVAAGGMDVCFPYTFVAPGASPRAFIVQLYRAGPSGANWLLLEPA